MSIDSHNRQRGNDEADASLWVDANGATEDVDVVIGAVKSNQSNNKAADELEAALGVKTKEPAAVPLGFWRNLSVLAGTGVNKLTFNITIAHSTDRPGSTTRSTPVRSLATLDSLIWLQTGVELRKVEAEWHVLGDPTLLNLERRVHQHARFQGQRPLRLEATDWSGPLLCTPAPAGWLLGLCNIVGIVRNLQLLRERIVDAWLCGLPDLPDPSDPDLTAIVLSTMPVHCTVATAWSPTAPAIRRSGWWVERLIRVQMPP